jgi:hypothetical protein
LKGKNMTDPTFSAPVKKALAKLEGDASFMPEHANDAADKDCSSMRGQITYETEEQRKEAIAKLRKMTLDSAAPAKP